MAKTTKEIVTLRERDMKNGGKSLLLDYVVDGVRQREFLKMYLVPEKTAVDRLQNKETRKQALALKAKRTLELQGEAHRLRSRASGIQLSDYIGQLEAKFKGAGHASYAKTLRNLKRWVDGYDRRIPLSKIDKDWLIGFKDNLSGELADGSVAMMFSNLGSVLNRAYREDLIPFNPMSKLEPSQRIQRPESTRDYLTIEEVRQLAGFPCRLPEVKRAFMFACFTGLRLSDIMKLDWSMVVDAPGGGLQVQERQTKTGNIVYVPLSANALEWLPERQQSGMVWNLPSERAVARNVVKWTKDAGIPKHVTFHVARHTYATLLLAYGADIYTVSSLLGHKSVATTQIYAKIVDEKKRKAVDNIPALNKKKKGESK